MATTSQLIAPPRPVPCLLLTGLQHHERCTCLGARDGDLPHWPT